MDTLELEAGTFSFGHRRLTRHDGEEVHLTTTEAELLAYLVRRPSQCVARTELLAEVWGYADAVSSRAVDTHMGRLRRKLELDPSHPEHLLTVHGTGYRFEPLTRPPTPIGGSERRSDPGRVLRLGPRIVYLDRRVVRRGDDLTALTEREARILGCLSAHPGQPVSRHALLRAAWDGHASRRAVDNAISRLRAKLEDTPADPVHLVTARRHGYVLHVATDPAPAGDVALVCTALDPALDLWTAHPDGTAAALAWIDEMLERHTRVQGGYFSGPQAIAFRQVDAALRWCVAVRGDLAEVPWPGGKGAGPGVRMALHAGRTVRVLRPATGRFEYVGAPVERVRALVSRATGGQLLVTEAAWRRAGVAARGLFTSRPWPGDPRVRSVAPRSGTRPPTSAAGGGHLPRAPARLLGRADALERLESLLRRPPPSFATVTGPGGIGKTRLAMELAHRWLASRGPVCWCDLSTSTTRDALLEAVAEATGVGRLGADPVEQLGRALSAAGTRLLVLDNAEAAVPDLREMVARWAAAAPTATLVVTSRHRLGLGPEGVLELPPLSPEASRQLFVDRVTSLDADFDEAVHGESIGVLAARLDHLPLAIELAAARARLLTPVQMLDRLGRERPDTDAVARSWALLTERERTALSQLALFRGGFTVEAAEAVLDLSGWPGSTAIDVLQELQEKSLLRAGHGEREPFQGRVALFESVRQFADRRLADRAAVMGRHAAFFGRFGHRLDALARQGGLQRLRQVQAELDNLLAGARYGLEVGAVQDAAGCTLAAADVVQRHGRFTPVLPLLEEVLARVEDPALRSWLLLAQARCLRWKHLEGEDWRRAVEESLALATLHGATLTRLHVLRWWSAVDPHHPEADGWSRDVAVLARDLGLAHVADYHEARVSARRGEKELPEALFQKAIAEARRRGDEPTLARALGRLAQLLAWQGRLDEAWAPMEEAARLHRAWDRRPLLTNTLGYLTYLALQRGDSRTFYDLNATLLDAARREGDPRREGDMLVDRAVALRVEERTEEALADFERAQPLVAAHGKVESLAYLHFRWSEALLAAGEIAGARRHVEQALALYGEDVRAVAVTTSVLAEVALEGADLHAARTAITEAEARIRTLQAASSLAVILCRRARIDRAQGRTAAAEEAIAEAEGLAERMGAGPASELGRHLSRARSPQGPVRDRAGP